MSELRQAYLFDLAYVCHITPELIDAMRVQDFFQLIIGIDAYRAEIKKMRDANQNS